MTNLYHKREELKRRGMTLLDLVRSDEGNHREYWGYAEGNNALLDHTATLTHVGNGEWSLSDFEHLGLKYPRAA